MLYVEQPVGVGFSQGIADIVDEISLAEQFMGFYKNFFNAFGLQGRQTYITGESYGGYYVSYIADEMLKTKDSTYFNVSGVILVDPLIGDQSLHYNSESSETFADEPGLTVYHSPRSSLSQLLGTGLCPKLKLRR